MLVDHGYQEFPGVSRGQCLRQQGYQDTSGP